MVELRNRLGALACCLGLLLPAAAGARERGCAHSKPALQERCFGKGQVVLELPLDWDCEVRELSDGLVVKDRNGTCTLEILRSPGLVSADGAARLYESLYLGENRLSEACAREVAARIGWAEECTVREYLPRARGRTVQALYAVADGQVVVGLLKCKLDAGKPPDWGLAAAIFASYRKPAAEPFVWSGGSGVFGPLYFLMKIPFNQFQNPD